MNSTQTSDPQGDLMTEIASRLRVHGCHRIVIDDCTDQRLVDVRWAVLRAGRVLGVRPTMTLSTRGGRTFTSVTVNITCTRPQRPMRAADRSLAPSTPAA